MEKTVNKPSKPTDAASIIIYKEIYNKYYVLMGKRSIKSKFMPSIYVFPGGAVDHIDYQANKLFKLSASINKNKIKTRSDNHTKAIMFAGIRETAEECNLYLAKKNEVMVYKHGGSWECMDHERDVIYLNKLWDDNDAFWKVCG